MVIQHNIMAINSHRQLAVNNNNLGKNLEKLSSGYRINNAADDAAGLAISEKMRAQITALDRAVLNAQDASSLIQTAEGAMIEVHDMLNRMVELTMQSANGTLDTTDGSNDRQKISDEIDQLCDEIDRISESTNFNGLKLLNGDLDEADGGSALKMQIGATSGSYDQISVNVRATTVDAMFSKTKAEIKAIIEDQDDAVAFIDDIRSAIDYVSTERSNLGAMQNRLDHTIANLGVSSENMTAAESRVRDVDMAKEMMDFTKNSVLSQAAQAMLAQANQQPQMVLQLLS